MSRYDALVSSGAWDDLVKGFVALVESGEASDFTLAELLRNKIYEVEGIE
jgi:hypothetical protein